MRSVPRRSQLAADIGDGLWTTGTGDTIASWEKCGGTGPVYSQITFCWAPDREEALDTAHRIWPTSAVPGQLSKDLPTPEHFETAASIVTRDMIAERMPCGPDIEPLVDKIEKAIAQGVDHVYLHQIGPDQEGMCRIWRDELAPRLKK